MMRHLIIAFLALSGLLPALAVGNLLRNGSFQDDWITRLTEVKNHHYCFSSEHYNRRDFNPDGWECKGSWEWQNADAPIGGRRMVLRGPSAEVTQRVNWVLVHDEKQLGSMADAGRFPAIVPVRSKNPLALVRDLTLRVRVKGTNVAQDAGSIEVGLCPPGGSTFLLCGSVTPPTVTASAPLPAGTYDWQWVEVKLPAQAWLDAIKKTDNDPNGPVLPGTASVALRYKGAGEVEIGQVELSEPGPAVPNLLANGGFDQEDANGYPAGWGKQEKYTYFPPGNYYLFNTWHNSTFPNRGPVAADTLITRNSGRSLKMIVPAGDEKSVASAPIMLNQQEPRLIEVQAWVKTDRLCMLQLDAVDENNKRLEGMLFIHKAAVSIGTDDWRLVRQVFRPRQPLKSMRLMLCARGVNGFTLDDTSDQPQNTATGTIWWDDITVTEPESTAQELAGRGVKAVPPVARKPAPYLENLSLGEGMIGANVLTAKLLNPGPAANLGIRLSLIAPSGRTTTFAGKPQKVREGGSAEINLPYELTESCAAYSVYHASLELITDEEKPVKTSRFWLTPWTAPIDVQLGNLYLLPEQKELVRLNFGLSQATMRKAATARLQIIRKGSGQVLKTLTIPATPEAFAAQRKKIPAGLRGDFTNLLLADLDVADLPVQPFNDPQRNWFVRATLLNDGGNALASVDSAPFCRLAHEPPQPAVGTVSIDTDNLLYVNGKPWMPWGVVYGFQPVYDGPADPGKYLDMHNLPDWGIYDRFTGEPYTRSKNDFNTLRYVAYTVTPKEGMEKAWKEQNLYASTAFATPGPVWSLEELKKQPNLDDYLAFVKTAPMVVSTTPGIEEAFSLFTTATPEKIKGMEEVVKYLRQQTGKPVMVSHGGFWNRFEWELAQYFDIFDPETEPFYPANLHTDLQPLIKGKAKASWLRPQMYEDVPYERWRFHTYVELMRGCRGWQYAHGPGDQSLFRGLHAEMKAMEPVVYSKDKGPQITIEPWVEHFSRRVNGKTCLIAATTHGMTVGTWNWSGETDPQAGRVKITDRDSEFRTAANNYGTDAFVDRGPRCLGIENLPDARAWPAGSKIVQWVKLDAKSAPRGLLMLAKADGRWTAAGQWGAFDVASLRTDEAKAHWFLSMMYRNAQGFAFEGWYGKSLPFALSEAIPGSAVALGNLPAAGQWVRLEIPLETISAHGKLLDGVAFLHEDGIASWGRTGIVTPDGKETVIWGDQLGAAPDLLAKTKITVPGLKAGAKVKVLFEDREITAEDGFFIDDFRGRDLYQRFGGGLNGSGYGDTPVALHVYEIP
ncbi:MAG: hypothetical protein ACYDCO_26400 [Armatimonadota bacterium]